MTKTDHLARAKDYIAKGEDYYRKAAEEIVAAIEEDGMTKRAVARELGRGETWVRDLVKWHESARPGAPFGGEDRNRQKREGEVRTALKDPERRQRALSELPTAQVEAIAREANEVAYDRAVAARQEKRDTPTQVTPATAGVGDWNPGESWADKLIMRVHGNARDLARHVQQWGLVLGSMPQDEAFEYLDAAERYVAEVRAALQERLADERQAAV